MVVVSEGKGKRSIQICKRAGRIMVLHMYITHGIWVTCHSMAVWVMGYCGCMGY